MQKRLVWWFVLLVLLAGCSRTRYRVKTDADAYTLLHEKTANPTWYLPGDFDVIPRPDSRLFDPTPIDDPLLHDPSPQLYAYALSTLPPRDPALSPGGAFIRPGTIPPRVQVATIKRLPHVASHAPGPGVALASHLVQVRELSASQPTVQAATRLAALRWAVQPPQPMPDGSLPEPGGALSDTANPNSELTPSDEDAGYGVGLRFLPLPQDAWEAIPANCRTRMLEFESIRKEYTSTYGREPQQDELDQSQRLALEDIVDTALLNSREYQSEKERLYSVAMRLSLERFDYDLKFSTGGNRTAANYAHNRDAGITVNGLSVPTTITTDKMLATSADLLARFSNSVVLTFNGASGFAADVGSDLLLDIEQTVFQRDGRFEGLTQAERNVIYAARDFRRSRKEIFTDLTTQYYNLLITYRTIEIESQNYFSLVREFQERAQESRGGFVPLFQVDQVEQNVLSGRSRLITRCNDLERGLDNLKIRMGLPTETPINLDLTELEKLTLRDELAVRGELIGRIRTRLEAERNGDSPSRVQLLSSGINLLEDMLEVYARQRKLEMQTPDTKPLEIRRLRMRTDEIRLDVEVAGNLLQAERDEEDPNVTIMLQRARDLLYTLSRLHERQLEFAAEVLPNTPLDEPRQRHEDFRLQLAELKAAGPAVIESGDVVEFQRFFDQMDAILMEFEEFAGELDALAGATRAPMTPDEALREAIREAGELVQLSAAFRAEAGGGLVPVEIDYDDAMLTGLVKRLDLITERNEVADRWRQIKYAADDLKSILNLNASQTISTRADVNRAFDFSFNDSETTLSATLDLPFNRRAQRNDFRQRLFDYQAALRSQMALEDGIKLAIRNDLRSLALGKEQYAINVAGAALAYQQVTSTALQLRLNVQGVFSRDFLDAQNAYTSRLSSVASGHIDYILDRMQLFLDLELLDVDESGFWQELYDEHHQPEGHFQLSPEALPAYGTLPHGLMFSKKLRRMLSVPVGAAMVHGPPQELESVPSEPHAIDLPAPDDPAPLVPLPPAIDQGFIPPPTVDVLP